MNASRLRGLHGELLLSIITIIVIIIILTIIIIVITIILIIQACLPVVSRLHSESQAPKYTVEPIFLFHVFISC